jgi:hypothetical protein
MYGGIGGKVVGEYHHSKKDTMETAGHAIALTKVLHITFPHVTRIRIRIDDTGVGGGVTDRLNEIVADTNQ